MGKGVFYVTSMAKLFFWRDFTVFLLFLTVQLFNVFIYGCLKLSFIRFQTRKFARGGEGNWSVCSGNCAPVQIDSLREKGGFFLPWEPQNNIFLFVWVGQREGQPLRWGGNPSQKTKSKCATRLVWQKRDQFRNPFRFALPGHYDLSLRSKSPLLWFMWRKNSSTLPKHFGILEVLM